MTDLHRLGEIDVIAYEQPLNMAFTDKPNNSETPFILNGLAAHIESWGEAMGCRLIRDVHQATWRRHYIGAMKRGTARAALKDYVKQRCRELGFAPKNDDEADALGILDWAVCEALRHTGILPYWRADNPLVQQFAGGRR